MYIITLDGKEEEGAYSVTDDEGDQVLYIFEEKDDALRFSMMLEDKNYPKMSVLEVEEDLIISACYHHQYKYIIFTSDDIVIPPDENKKDDFI